MTGAIPDYRNLDLSGEAQRAAARMEARAQAPASIAMFERLVLPLLAQPVKTVLEVGCGTAALARKIAAAAPQAAVHASDKSQGMLQAARLHAAREKLTNLSLHRWDVLDAHAFPLPGARFDLIISSVVMPYLDDDQVTSVVSTLAAHLAPGGVLAFVEQDLMSDMLNYPEHALVKAIFDRDQRVIKRSSGLGLRPILRAAGLDLLPRRSFLWTEDTYDAYTQDLLRQFADNAHHQGRITARQRDAWNHTLSQLAASGDFYYGIVYHLIAGKRS